MMRQEAGVDRTPARGAWPWRDLVARQFERIRRGALELRERGGSTRFGNPDPGEISASVEVLDPRFYADIALGGSIGAAESYMCGRWRTNDLTDLVRLMVRNRGVMDGMDTHWARLRTPLFHCYHWLRRNTERGSRANIGAHYDLGNEFFRLFLDRSLMYSCALFAEPGMTLDAAQEAKLDRICRVLNLEPGEHVLEIGTGWGGFALHAAGRYGCRVTTTTISRQQHALATERVRAAGLADRVQVLDQDYRQLSGCYDKLVSIEMIEAVGHRYYETFFRQCGRLLARDGLFLLQAITIEDCRYQRALSEVDFIQRYIFPGSCIPSVSALTGAAGRASDLRLIELVDLGAHYAETMAHWRQRFLARLPEVRALGYPESFIRMWEFYLCYCEGGFLERAISDVHMLFARPDCLHPGPVRAGERTTC